MFRLHKNHFDFYLLRLQLAQQLDQLRRGFRRVAGSRVENQFGFHRHYPNSPTAAGDCPLPS
jgi:hypothetical protein